MSNKTVEAYFVNETLPDDFTNVLGALLLAGWTYSVENTCDDQGTNRVKVSGYRPERDGKPSTTARPIQVVWEWTAENGWAVAADQTGHPLKKPGAGGRMIQFVAPDKMVDTIGRGTRDWNLLPTFDAEAVEKEWEEEKKAARAARAKQRKEQREAKRKAKSDAKAIEAGPTKATEEPAKDEAEAEAEPTTNGVVSEEVIEG